jgi:hypothetical protein
VLGCLDGMTVTLTVDAVETDDLTEDGSERSPKIKVLPTPVVQQVLLAKEVDGAGDVTLSGSVAGLLGGTTVYEECTPGDGDDNDVPRVSNNSPKVVLDSRSPLPTDAGGTAFRGVHAAARCERSSVCQPTVIGCFRGRNSSFLRIR